MGCIAHATLCTLLCGLYRSPEIWRNRPYDAKSDMWAAGVILYELCALRPPFRGQDMKELSKRVQSGTFARITPRFSSDLDAVIRRLLRVDPRQRPTAAEALELPQVASRLQQVESALEGTAGAVRAAAVTRFLPQRPTGTVH